MRILHSMVTTVEKLPSLRDSYLLTFTIESRALSVSLAVGCVEILLRVTAIYMPHPNEIYRVRPGMMWMYRSLWIEERDWAFKRR